jgi:hypothetical protein
MSLPPDAAGITENLSLGPIQPRLQIIWIELSRSALT